MIRPPAADAGAAQGVWWLLWPRVQAVANAARSHEGRGGVRWVFFGVLGAAFMAGAFAGSRWLFGQFGELEVLAELLIGRMLEMVLLFFIGLLLFSNTIAAFTTLYLADDLPLLMSSPVAPARLWLARLVDTWTQASWMMLVFALPILAGCGPVLGAGWWVYAVLPVLLFPLTVLCAAGGCMVTMVLARLMPAQRTHDVLLVLAMVGFLVVYIAFRLARPERFLEPGGFADLASLIGSLRDDGARVTPAAWVVAALFAVVRGEWGGAALPVVALYSAAAAACAVGAWLAEWLYVSSFNRAQEGRIEGEGVLGRLRGRGRRPARWAGSVVGALVVRDTRVFFRTTGQWTQVLLIAALVAVYLFNFDYFRSLKGAGMIGPRGLFFVNLVLGGLVVTTLAVRFLYPAVSLEGRAFWAVQVAPVTPWELLRSKVRWGMWPLMAVAVGLVVASNLIVGLPGWVAVMSAGVAVVMTTGLCGMGVGMGAMAPRFHLTNPARIASGLGGVLYMLIALAYLVALLLLIGWPLAALWRFVEMGDLPRAVRLWQLGAMLGGALVLSGVAYGVPLWLGARSLARREG